MNKDLRTLLQAHAPVELQETGETTTPNFPSQAVLPVVIQGDTYANDYSSWKDVFSVNGFDVNIGQAWDTIGIPLEALVLPDVHVNTAYIEPCFVWRKQKILVLDALDTNIQSILYDSDWLIMDMHTDPEQLNIKLQERS